MIKINEVITTHRSGDRFEYRVTVTDTDGNLLNDAGINVEERQPDGTIANYTLASPELSNAGTGLYDFVRDFTVHGDWFFEFRLTAGKSYLVYLPVSDNVNYVS
jgi:hypothetical protein